MGIEAPVQSMPSDVISVSISPSDDCVVAMLMLIEFNQVLRLSSHAMLVFIYNLLEDKSNVNGLVSQ